MADIKVRDVAKKTVKAIDKSAIATERFKDTIVHTKEKAENATNEDGNINEYGSSKIGFVSNRTVDESVHQFNKQGKKSLIQTKDNIQKSKIKIKAFKEKRLAKKTIKGTTKGAVKNTKTAIKTSKEVAKNTKRVAQHSVKASQRAIKLARETAKATARGVKVAVKATISTVKAIIAGTKALIAALVAGGWVAVVAVIIICLVGLLCSSIFGIFFSSEDTGGSKTMNTVVNEINQEMANKITNIQNNNTYDDYKIDSDRAEWKEVLAVYTVKVSKGTNEVDVITLDDNKIAILKEVFWDMNTVSSEVKTEKVKNEDGVEEDKKILHIKITSKSPDDMASQYHFNTAQKNQLAELMSEEYANLWSSAIYGSPLGSPNIVQLQDFGTAPYGFLDEDILYILTRLLKDEVISLIYNNEVQNITSEDTLTKILKRDYYDRTIIKIRQKIEMSLINDLKSVARNAFNVINLRDDEDGMVEDFKRDCLQSTLNKLNKIAGYYHISNTRYKYPGQDVKDESTSMMERLLRIRDVGDFFKEVSNCKTELVSLAPKIEMVLDFFDGTQKEQFDEARKTLEIYDNNKDFADKTDELNSVVEKITNILTSEEPYSEIHNLPMYRKELIDILTNIYDVKSAPIIKMIQDTMVYFEEETKNAGVDIRFVENYLKICKDVINTLEHSNELKDIFAQQTRIDQLKDSFINALIYEKMKNNADLEDSALKEETKIVKRTIIRTDVLMNRSYEINSKEDIDKYVEELKNKLLKEFEKNNNLTIR